MAVAPTTQKASVKADSRFTRLAVWSGTFASCIAGMMMIELEPPRMQPSIVACTQDHSIGNQPSQRAPIDARATTATVTRNVDTASRLDRGAELAICFRSSWLPPSTTAQVQSGDCGWIWATQIYPELSAEIQRKLDNSLTNIDSVEARAEGFGLTRRMGPGYLDWPLEEQGVLVGTLSEAPLPGIEVIESGAILPEKTITGLYGLIPGMTGDL